MNRRTFATQAGTFLAAAGAAPALRARPTAGSALVPHTSIHRVEADGVLRSETAGDLVLRAYSRVRPGSLFDWSGDLQQKITKKTKGLLGKNA